MSGRQGQRIRALREAMGMKQVEFALLFPVSNITVSRWEGGYHEPLQAAWKRIEQLERQLERKQKRRA